MKGRVHFSTRVPRKKIENIRKHPQISFTVNSGKGIDDYHGVLIQGNAEIIEVPETIDRYMIAFAHRHLGSEEHPYFRLLTSGKVCVVCLNPAKGMTWDYRQMAE